MQFCLIIFFGKLQLLNDRGLNFNYRNLRILDILKKYSKHIWHFLMGEGVIDIYHWSGNLNFFSFFVTGWHFLITIPGETRPVPSAPSPLLPSLPKRMLQIFFPVFFFLCQYLKEICKKKIHLSIKKLVEKKCPHPSSSIGSSKESTANIFSSFSFNILL